MDDSVVLGVFVVALFVQSAVIVLGLWLHLRGESAWRAERTQLLNLVVADSPRAFATLQKASAVKPDPTTSEPAHDEERLSIGGDW